MLLKVKVKDQNKEETRLLNCQYLHHDNDRVVFSSDNKNYSIKRKNKIFESDFEQKIESAFMNNKPLNIEILNNLVHRV